MFAKQLYKQAYSSYYGSAGQFPMSMMSSQAPGPATPIDPRIGSLDMWAALLAAPDRRPKHQSNLYDYMLANPNKESGGLTSERFRTRNPAYYSQVEKTRKALNNAGGYGVFNLKNNYNGTVDPKVLRDAFLLEPREDKKEYMLKALQRLGGTNAKDAVKMINKSKIIDPSIRERWNRIEPGKSTIGSQISRVRGASLANTPGTPQYTGPGSYGGRYANWVKKQYDWGARQYTDWFNRKNKALSEQPPRNYYGGTK